MANVVAFDASFLLPVFSRKLHAVPQYPSTRKPIRQYDKKIDCLLSRLEKEKTKMLIPAPALSEILVEAGAERMHEYLKTIFLRSAFRVVPFKQDAAIVVAVMNRNAMERGDKRSGSKESWQKVKFDRQILAIAKVNKAKIIYSDDQGLRNFAEQAGLRVISSHELDLP